MSDLKNCQERLNILEENIRQDCYSADIKRKRYKRYVSITGVSINILYLSATLFLALSFVEGLQDIMRVISLIITTIGALFSSISNTLAWGEKLQQRTETFLRLDELLMDLRYEVNIDEDTLNTYINRYKDIYREDNKKGLENARTVADSLKNLSNESKNK